MFRYIRHLLTAILAFMLTFSSVSLAAVEIPEYYFPGKDGWYFSDFNGNIDSYEGNDLYTARQLNTIKDGLTILRDKLAENDIEFLIVLAPNKERIYSEFMPDKYGAPALENRLSQLCLTLGDGFDLVCPMTALIAAKSDLPEYDLYYKTDIHWNYLGGYIGAKEVLSELGKNLPEFENVKVSSHKVEPFSRDEITREEDADPDEDEFYETEYTISFSGAHWGEMTDIVGEGEKYRFYTEYSPDDNMCVIGDSFSIAMAPYLGQYYRNIYVHHLSLDANETLEEILKEYPSVVIFEASETLFDLIEPFAEQMISGD